MARTARDAALWLLWVSPVLMPLVGFAGLLWGLSSRLSELPSVENVQFVATVAFLFPGPIQLSIAVGILLAVIGTRRSRARIPLAVGVVVFCLSLIVYEFWAGRGLYF